MKTLGVQHRTDPAWPGILRVELTGLVVDGARPRLWAPLSTPDGEASLVSLFDFRKAVVAFRGPPTMVPGAPQWKPGAFLCGKDQYELLVCRAAVLNDLGVRRAVFCSEPLALEWAAEEVRLAGLTLGRQAA